MSELDCLMQELLKKQEQSFVFRGHASAQWHLQPKFFRNEEIKKSWINYALTEEDIQEAWFENETTLSTLNSFFGYTVNLTKATFKGYHIIYKGKLIPLRRLLSSYVDLMKYNYNLSRYTSDNRNYYTSEYLEKEVIKYGPPEFWTKFDTFLFLLQELSRIIECRDAKSGKLLNNPVISDDLTVYDETRPQHYNVATSALDWTHNPYIALYFAGCDFIDNFSSSIITCKDTHIALFSYKQLKSDNDISVMLKEPDKTIKNERAEKQEGLFTFMPKARSFYLMNGLWPKIENYIHLVGNEFLLEWYVINLNKNTIPHIQRELAERKINKISMGLDENLLLAVNTA